MRTGPGRKTILADRFALGLHIPQRFDRVLDIDECWLQSPASTAIVNTVRAFCLEQNLSVYSTITHTGFLRNLVIREGKQTGEVMVNLVTSEEHDPTIRALCAALLQHFPEITTIVNNITTRKSQVAIGEHEIVVRGSRVNHRTDRQAGDTGSRRTLFSDQYTAGRTAVRYGAADGGAAPR